MTQPDTSTLAGRIAVEQAALEGKPVQKRDKGRKGQTWCELGYVGMPDAWLPRWDLFDYRIKPTEPLRFWINVYKGRVGHPRESPDKCHEVQSDEALVRPAVPLVELTPEIETCLKANGLL